MILYTYDTMYIFPIIYSYHKYIMRRTWHMIYVYMIHIYVMPLIYHALQ